jgi:hypothetical protein
VGGGGGGGGRHLKLGPLADCLETATLAVVFLSVLDSFGHLAEQANENKMIFQVDRMSARAPACVAHNAAAV